MSFLAAKVVNPTNVRAVKQVWRDCVEAAMNN